MAQLLPLVVRSNASPNSWLLLFGMLLVGFVLLAAFVTSIHGVVVVVGSPVVVAFVSICSVSTACAMVSSSCGWLLVVGIWA